MKYTAKFLIEKRKEKWEKTRKIEEDRIFREAVANELYENKELLEEVKNNPEYLIELEFVIVDKEQKTVPFFINEVQKDFINNKLNKAIKEYKEGKITDLTFLVLKGRQQGFTSVITAYQLACSLLKKNFQGFTLSDKADNTETIFQNKAKFPYDQLPEILQPTEKFNNRRQLLFEKLNSNWEVDTATENVGRSKTVNFFHGSECAFWKSMAKVQAGLGEAFTNDCIKIYESTANGYNDFQKLWINKSAINCFYEWWKTSEYRIRFENEKTKEDFIKKIEKSKEWIFERIKILLEKHNLELEQVYWYYKKYQGYIDKELIKQEYPCSAEEAFLASGNCYFDKEKVINRIEQLKEPLKVGSFIYDYDGLKITNIKWKNEANGFIKLYELPKEKYPYVISGDTAGEGSDYFIGQVLDNTNGKQVAVLRKEFDADEYTRQMYCLGKYYNNALIGIESNFDTFPIKELERIGYKKQYIREKEDTFTGNIVKAYGFRTDRITRPLILSELQAIVNDHIENINDKETLEEMLVFVRNEKGRPEAQEGCHDDLVMALAIAYHIREQQDMTVKIDKNDLEYNIMKDFGFEEEVEDDYGSKIEVF
jgi:hypothetical protein